MSIKDFLLARIAKDEERAGVMLDCMDKTRRLRECEAKRELIQVASEWQHTYNDEDMWYSCPLAVGHGETEPGSGYSGDDTHICRCGLEARKLRILAPLAAIYRDHPDYAGAAA